MPSTSITSQPNTFYLPHDILFDQFYALFVSLKSFSWCFCHLGGCSLVQDEALRSSKKKKIGESFFFSLFFLSPIPPTSSSIDPSLSTRLLLLTHSTSWLKRLYILRVSTSDSFIKLEEKLFHYSIHMNDTLNSKHKLILVTIHSSRRRNSQTSGLLSNPFLFLENRSLEAMIALVIWRLWLLPAIENFLVGDFVHLDTQRSATS